MIYISGKITDTTDYLERFSAAEGKLRACGLVPVNPAKVNSQLPQEASYSDYIRMSLTMIDLCDSIYLLPDWKTSRGARLEMAYAELTGKDIIEGTLV